MNKRILSILKESKTLKIMYTRHAVKRLQQRQPSISIDGINRIISTHPQSFMIDKHKEQGKQVLYPLPTRGILLTGDIELDENGDCTFVVKTVIYEIPKYINPLKVSRTRLLNVEKLQIIS